MNKSARGANQLHRRILALASPDKTLAQIATAAGCHSTYVQAVLGRAGVGFLPAGTGGSKAARSPSLPASERPGAVYDSRAEACLAHDRAANDELLSRLQRYHPNVKLV